jgi:hypothetical protein
VHADAGRPAADADRDGFATTGVSGVLAVDDHRFLAVERSFVTGWATGFRKATFLNPGRSPAHSVNARLTPSDRQPLEDPTLRSTCCQ